MLDIEMKPLVCQNCGAAINRRTMRCDYCGTQYERQREQSTVQFLVERPGTHRICATVRLADEMARHNPEAATRYALDGLRREVADGLLAYMKISTTKDFDPLNQCQIIRGEVRVIDPTFTY